MKKLNAAGEPAGVVVAVSGTVSTDKLLGRDTAATGPVEEIGVGGGIEFTGTTAIQRSALTGDVTASAGSAATTIANDAVTYAKMQNVSATDKVLGRSTAGSGDVEEIACTAAGRTVIAGASATAIFDGLSPDTTAGDTIVNDGTNAVRLGIGTAGQVIVADLAQTNKLLWSDPPYSVMTHRVCQFLPNPGLATFSSVGMVAPTTEGTLTSNHNAGGATISMDGSPTTTANVNVGWYTAFDICQGRWFYDVTFVWRAPAYLNRRTWLGLFSADPAAISSPTGIDCVAFRYDDGAGVDTTSFFRAVTSDVSGSPTVVVLDGTSGNGTMAVSLNTNYRARIRVNSSGNIEFFNDSVLMTTISTTLPQTSDPLGIAFRQRSLTAVTPILRFVRAAWSMGPS